MNILLIEPNHRNKYPPLGLMKISTFHKARNDTVQFFKGTKAQYYKKFGDQIAWDRVYIGAVFTFQYKYTVDAIQLAKRIIKYQNFSLIFIGGAAATLLYDRLKQFGVTPVNGLLDVDGKIGLKGDSTIDGMIPDYSILDDIDYKYPTADAYIGYSTRGCVRKCPFCAVPKIEPKYCAYKDIKIYVNEIINRFGEKKDLLLLDNNVLASKSFNTIISDIIELGFEKGAKFNGKRRYIDFNQGLDARLLSEKKIQLLSKIAIHPVRVAFDDVKDTELYKEKIKLLAKYDMKYLSNYLLFNYKDKPIDLYKRIKTNIQLNDNLDTKVFSFPMKYIPLDATDRSYVSPNWKKKELRAIQVILNATHGVVGIRREFTMRAFGKSQTKFQHLLWMPEEYIFNRDKYEDNKAVEWEQQYDSLAVHERHTFKKVIENNEINLKLLNEKGNKKIREVLSHYKILWKKLKFDPSQQFLFVKDK